MQQKKLLDYRVGELLELPRRVTITFAVFMLIDGSNLVGSYMGATARVLGCVRQ